MARFGAALVSGRLLRPETFTAMLVPQRTRRGNPTVYGLGFRVGVWNGRAEAWQHGGQPEVSTLLYLWPERKLSVAILCNLEGVAPALLDLAREVALLLVSPTLTPPGKGR
jgi:CubicO group peptidase (beta-lactamase class C family)